jgi:hypothetical protein
MMNDFQIRRHEARSPSGAKAPSKNGVLTGTALRVTSAAIAIERDA